MIGRALHQHPRRMARRVEGFARHRRLERPPVAPRRDGDVGLRKEHLLHFEPVEQLVQPVDQEILHRRGLERDGLCDDWLDAVDGRDRVGQRLRGRYEELAKRPSVTIGRHVGGMFDETVCHRAATTPVYTQIMPLSIPAVQGALREEGLDGWLLYDFHGSNPIARRIAGLDNGGKMTTRRWYYLIPASGEPRKLMHAIEPYNLDHLPGGKTIYSRRETLAMGLKSVLGGMTRVAMEYSPGNAIPYISRVDAGTIEAVRALGTEVVSSGDLVQRFEAVWSADALRSHRRASDALYRIKDRAFEFVRATRRGGGTLTEFDVQRAMTGWFTEEGLVTDAPPVVAAQEHAGDPHYMPTEAK